MDLLQKIGLMFNESKRVNAAQRKVLLDRTAQARAKLELLYDKVAERYPIKRREECTTLSDEAYQRYVLEVIATRSAMSTIAATVLAARAADKEDDWDDLPKNLEF